MQITLTGASGFIGGRLIARLLERKHSLVLLGRRRPARLPDGVKFFEWDANSGAAPPVEALEGSEAVIHLAGEPVAQRWTAAAKEKIRSSRVGGTAALLGALKPISSKPHVFIGASAIGYYGDRGEELLAESAKPGTGFLPEICVNWEAASREARNLGIRTVLLRIGIVLGPGGGALAKMVTPFRLGAGGKVGSGQQWMSWIHVEDAVGLMLHALETPVEGPMNVTAPNPVRNVDFTRALGKALRRPTLIPVPEFGLSLVFGEMATMLTSSQRVDCAVARQTGYRFQYPELDGALSEIQL
ncbi:MAG: TIGR01777 family oxidoreductase [Bryobacterales bacterium]|nr:TIGR01777 family oxidoreductase [Bryobacterales bacterium]